MKEKLYSGLTYLCLAIYAVLAVWQITTPDLLTAGNAGVVVIYAYVWLVAAAALGVAVRSKVAWWVAVAADVMGAATSLALDHAHAREFTRVTLILALVRLALLSTPWIRGHVRVSQVS